MAKNTKTSADQAKKATQPSKQQTTGRQESKSLSSRAAELREFFEQSKGELKKVVWPTRKETTATTIAVLIVVALMGVFLGAVDTLLSKLMQLVLS